MAGSGNFDLTLDEVALILELLDSEDFKALREMYKQLALERLGDE